MHLTARQITWVEGLQPGLIGQVGDLHSRYYVRQLGWSIDFEILVLRGLSDFAEGYDCQKDFVLTAHSQERLIASVFVLGRTAHPDGAQLRFFLVDPEFRGLGLGAKLLRATLNWCKTKGFVSVFLWTVDNLVESRRLYEKAGFRITDRIHDARFSKDRDTMKMQMRFADLADVVRQFDRD